MGDIREQMFHAVCNALGGAISHLTGGTLLCRMVHAVHFRPMVRGKVHERFVLTPGEPSTTPRIGRCVTLIGSPFK
jgi:hypothetical protein